MRRLGLHYGGRRFRNPPALTAPLTRPAAGYVWLFVRLYLGWQWLTAGWHKLYGPTSVGWVHSSVTGGKPLHVGDTLLALWQHAVTPTPGGTPQVGYAWYRDFLQLLIAHQVQHWVVYVITLSEVLAGLALILGACTAIAAGAGAVMNFNYLLAGSASINPVLLVGALLLLLAWRSAGYVGLDRWLLPLLGTPWQPGRLFRRDQHGPLVREEVRRTALRPRQHRLRLRQRLRELRHRQVG